MYHVQLRQFPHNLSRFNLTEPQLHAIVEPWAREQLIELGERMWSPQHATLTILEGPRLPMSQLSMGRGWQTAQRQGKDVSERVLALARRQASAAAPGTSAPRESDQAADALAVGVQLASLLGEHALALLRAWRAVSVEHPALAPSERLALAEQMVERGGASHD